MLIFICACAGLVYAYLVYAADARQTAVWDMAYACERGAGPVGGLLGIVMSGFWNFIVGGILALCGAIIISVMRWPFSLVAALIPIVIIFLKLLGYDLTGIRFDSALVPLIIGFVPGIALSLKNSDRDKWGTYH